ncbi:hypothetical protein M431DRAFT_450573 [Trichoderma harzianum CBS 226.95]|uniref:Uncharacterized protein n=1 Tax=Trichoderma harzianum CBS 226.95 TaxID=983964 RepID=A0A2T4AAN9_TRIHA|nr:hypothetical protein M431DRAFT_450573 [Trichoderma harzianum CBS 226.95]PTB54126.1 hypothetical protein M431DRAFT_450573 [Trichoderma harzianum CBS 226.95]
MQPPQTLACPTALDAFFEPRFSPFPAAFGSPSPTKTGLTPNPPSCSGALPRVELVALLFSWTCVVASLRQPSLSVDPIHGQF